MLSIVLSVLGSASFLGFIMFLIQRRDDKQKDQKEIKEKLVKMERDQCRIQLLVLMSDFPKNKSEILKVAEHYFNDIEGNWYMSDMFNEYCKEHEIEIPAWFSVRS